jgi:putative acetyltransferase
MTPRILKYNPALREQVIEVWERSVRATHDFLEPADIDFYKSLVQQIDFGAFEVFCVIDDHNEMIGILGTADRKLEMLFLVPESIGMGIGKFLLEFVLYELNVDSVDVNEGNLNAVNFYKHFGFKVYDRKPIDDSGKPYPILKMKR